MTVEYLSAKLIEKAMSEQNAYVPPNRNLIVAAETLKKQQAEIARLQKDVDRYEEQNRALLDEQIPCTCGYDDPNDVCGKHHPTFKRKLEGAHNDAIEAAAMRVSLYFREERLQLMQRSSGAHLGIADCVRALKK